MEYGNGAGEGTDVAKHQAMQMSRPLLTSQGIVAQIGVLLMCFSLGVLAILQEANPRRRCREG